MYFGEIMTKLQSWQCGGCKTWYAPFIEKCDCECKEVGGIRHIRQPYLVPIQEYWHPYKYVPWNPVITWSSTTSSVASNPETARE